MSPGTRQDARARTPAGTQALEQALACHRVPALLAAALARPLPPDMTVLLRIVAGDEALAASSARACGEPVETVVEAASFYIQQLQFLPQADSYRVLGVTPDAADARIKEHYRLLVHWLHPDRNHDGWESAYADRVNRAWQDLRTPARRRAYDAERQHPAPAYDYPPPPSPAPRLLMLHETAPPAPARRGRYLPQIVVSMLALVAAGILGIMWYGRNLGQARPIAPPASIAPVPAPENAALAALQAGEAGGIDLAAVTEAGEAELFAVADRVVIAPVDPAHHDDVPAAAPAPRHAKDDGIALPAPALAAPGAGTERLPSPAPSPAPAPAQAPVRVAPVAESA
ncbi:J domain-containing protein, partial [Arenimonas composti]